MERLEAVQAVLLAFFLPVALSTTYLRRITRRELSRASETECRQMLLPTLT